MPDEKIADICHRYHIREMAIFGSAARGNLGPDSDVNVLVDLEPNAQLGWNFFGIAEELEPVLGRRVDLGTTDSLRPFARPAVLREAIVIYAS